MNDVEPRETEIVSLKGKGILSCRTQPNRFNKQLSDTRWTEDVFGSKIIRAFSIIRVKKLISNAVLLNKYLSSHNLKRYSKCSNNFAADCTLGNQS